MRMGRIHIGKDRAPFLQRQVKGDYIFLSGHWPGTCRKYISDVLRVVPSDYIFLITLLIYTSHPWWPVYLCMSFWSWYTQHFKIQLATVASNFHQPTMFIKSAALVRSLSSVLAELKPVASFCRNLDLWFGSVLHRSEESNAYKTRLVFYNCVLPRNADYLHWTHMTPL